MSAAADQAPSPPSLASRTYVALLHYPVYDKRRRVVASAVTNLDIHDIARSSRTYGLAGFFLTTPVEAQRELARRIVAHWQGGFGAVYNEKRQEALTVLRVVGDLDEARAQVLKETGREPLLCATAAGTQGGVAPAELLRDVAQADRPLLLMFGTGWGLTEECLASADRVLRPIRGGTDYNHLSVRAAVAIMLDRLFGAR